jgi:hypothetical protein
LLILFIFCSAQNIENGRKHKAHVSAHEALSG